MALFLIADGAFGQAIKNGPIKMRIVPFVTRARSHAPVPATIVLNSRDMEVVRGDLDVRIMVGDRLAHRLQVPDLALTNGENKIRILFPEVRVVDPDHAVRARAIFVSGTREFDLGENDIVVPVESRRNSTIVNVQSKVLIARQTQLELVDSMLLHRFAPERSTLSRIELVTNPSTVATEELPGTALPLCGVDVIVIHGDPLAELTDNQMAALLAWVRAGGSLCAIPPLRVLEDRQMEFLNGLAPGDPARPAYELDAERRLQINNPEPSGVRLTRPGLGRAVIVEDPSRIEPWLESEEWDRAVCHLWNISRAQTEAILESSTPGEAGVWRKGNSSEFARSVYSAKANPQTLQDLTFDMRPQRAKSVPFATFFGIIVVFLLLAAPGDYYLLGWLKLRRYTWWFLPGCSLLFTWLTASIAEQSLGPADFRATYDVVDVGEQGEVVRNSRFEMVFVATPQPYEVPLKQSIYVDLTQADEKISKQLSAGLQQGGALSAAEEAASQRDNEIPTLTGRPGYEYRVEQQLRKWAPVVSRQTTLGGKGVANPIPWLEISRLKLKTVEGWRAAVGRIQEVDPSAEALLLAGGTVQATSAATQDGETDSLRSFLRSISVSNDGNSYFSVVTQVGPTGHSNLEDLLLHDATSTEEWVLIVIVPQGANKTIYRFRSRARQ